MANTSLERGLTILAEVAGGADTTVESVASRLGIPVSTTYRYFKTLKDRGFIIEDAGAYRPGRALLALGGQYSVQNHLAEVGTAVLRGIVENVGETAVMIIRVGASAMCLRCAETDKAFKYTFAVNELLPLYAGAGQRLLLAWSPPDVTKQVLDGELIRFTKNTLDADQIRSSLVQIRSTGWAMSRGELDPGSVSVAVPVFASGEVVCSLNVAGPEARCGSKTWVTSALKVLNRAAENLSLSLESLAPTINTRKALDAD
ncbi:IclR family transcriptional regulator [Arthrobacter sp. 2RAF6]|uniref:IclR family transcriptional regulator n=1 Tax=Arthrobacter sp. 2RAF6 TaxID=3233002 RepID=UPI003F93ACCC